MFCGRDGPMSGEHLFPCWALELLSFGEHELTLWEMDAAPKVIPRGNPNIKVRRVCAACNHGWMSDLETEVAPILGSMIQREPAILNGQQQQVIAGWIAKTAVVGAWTVPTVTAVSQPDREYVFRTRKPPKGSHIWLAAWSPEDDVPLRYDVHQFALAPDGKTLLPEKGYLATFFIGHLGFQMLRPPPGLIIQTSNGEFESALVPIWPPRAGTASWPPRARIATEAVLDAFARRF